MVGQKIFDLINYGKDWNLVEQRQIVPSINTGLCKFFPMVVGVNNTETTISVIQNGVSSEFNGG